MTNPQPRCPALHPDLPYSRCTSEEGHAGEHVNTPGSLWDEREHIGPKGEADWHGLYLAENRRAEQAERERDEARATTNQGQDRQSLIDRIQEQDRIIRKRNGQIKRMEGAELRAEKAKQERDEATARAEGLDLTVRLVRQQRDQAVEWAKKVEDERDEAVKRAEKHRRAEGDHRSNARCWMKTSEEWQATAEEWEKRALAAESRTRTVTDEMVQRGKLAFYQTAEGDLSLDVRVRRSLTAALTDPPARPEWADLADKIDDAMTGPGGIDGDTLAERLHAEGVRVVTEEQP